MKLNKAGVKYILEGLEAFEEHTDFVLQAVINDDKVYSEFERCRFSYDPITIVYSKYAGCGEYDYFDQCVSVEDFLSFDYEATMVKHVRLRAKNKAEEEEKVKKEALAEAAANERRKEIEASNRASIEKETLLRLMAKYPEIKSSGYGQT